MSLIAHTSHWLVNVAYVLPFVGFLVWLFITSRRERRKAAREKLEASDA
ncbi:MAG: hypothetical protein H0U24_07520 [Thermoleophilaceae bacterium]|nr:hypothetical protein [Thermoleophilaceae bacterium]